MPIRVPPKQHLAGIIPKTKPIISAARILHIPTKPGLRDVVEFRAHYEGIKPIIKRASSLNSSPPKQRGFASFYTHRQAHQSTRRCVVRGMSGEMGWLQQEQQLPGEPQSSSAQPGSVISSLQQQIQLILFRCMHRLWM